MMNLEAAMEQLELLTEENTNLENQVCELLEKVEELESKLKSQASEAGQRTKRATAEYKDMLAERDARIEQLTVTLHKQEDLVNLQQTSILELQEKCESAYESHNDMVRKFTLSPFYFPKINEIASNLRTISLCDS